MLREFTCILQDESNYFQYEIPSWEKGIMFDPLKNALGIRKHPTWISLGKSIPLLADSDMKFQELHNIYDNIDIRDPENFVAGGIHENFKMWENIIQSNDEEILSWIKGGIDVTKFFRHFKGNFKGRHYDSDAPMKNIFPNSNSCKDHVDFVRKELYERIQNGSVSVVGKVGECVPPFIVMPLTVEPTKPRLCHDDRYINLWTVDKPFHLDNLKHVPRLVEKGMFLISCDEKSGYDHVKLSQMSSKYFGIQFGGWFLQYNTLPFGWKGSPFIYQSIGMVVTSYLRRRSILNIQYIDDRLIMGFLNSSVESEEKSKGIVEAACIFLNTMSKLGYTLSLKKSSLIPRKCLRYLRFIIDSEKQAFILPDDKKETFMLLRESLLSSRNVDIKTLQRFAGKCISMALAVPAAKLYCRVLNSAISWCMKNSKDVKVSDELKNEILYWRFLDKWDGYVSWRNESHKQILLASDASLFKYGAAILSGDKDGMLFGDFWDENDSRPIHLKEAEAVLKVLQSLGDSLKNHRVDLYSDNKAVICSWENQGGKDGALNAVIKTIFDYVLLLNINLNLHYVPSNLNKADEPSRSLNMTDSMLSKTAWDYVQQIFGPHSVDLMAMDSNCMKDIFGHPLRHFTPFPTPNSAGVNVFAQDLSNVKNPYVFPPFQLVFPLLKFLKEQRLQQCTVILPRPYPLPIWWSFFIDHCIQKVVLGKQGDVGILNIPSKNGFVEDIKGLKFDLLVTRLSFV